MKRILALALVIGVGVLGTAPLSGCAMVQGWFGTQTASDVTTLGEAYQAAGVATDTVDFAVNNITLSADVLTKIRTYSTTVHAALTSLYADQKAGRPLVYSSFNAAYTAFVTYTAQAGVPLAAKKPVPPGALTS